MKIAVNTNSLRKNFSHAAMVELIKGVGATGIEWGLGGLDSIREDTREMVRLTRDAGLELVSFINGPKLHLTDEVLRYTEAVAAAGGKMLRVAHPWYAWDYNEALHQPDSYDYLLKITREGMERLESAGRQAGVRYVLETHGSSVFASPVADHFILQGLDPQVFGIIYDPANTFIEGFVRPRGAVEVMGQYLAYVHIKNFRWEYCMKELPRGRQRETVRTVKCSLESGLVDYEEVFFALKVAKFEGWLSFEEMYSAPDAVAAEIKAGIAHLQECEANAPAAPCEPFKSFNW